MNSTPCLLARNHPTLFSALAIEYSTITQLALEEAALRTDRQVLAKVRNLATRAGEVNAVPHDLVCIHLMALSILAGKVRPTVAKACAQHARLLLLKMMGELALYYRDKARLARNGVSEAV